MGRAAVGSRCRGAGRRARLIEEALGDVARHGLASDLAAAARRLKVSASLEDAVAGATLVQESGPERLEVKREVFARLDAAAGAETILATSSSFIVTSRFAEGLKGRHRCLVAHPVNPPHVVPIVELSGAPFTAPETIARARAIYDSVGQVPIVVKKEIDGFILNRMQAVLLSEAMRLVGEGFRLGRRPGQDHPRRARASGGRSWGRSRPSNSMRRAAFPTTARATARRCIEHRPSR